MAGGSAGYNFPYTPTPGGSTPSAHVGPDEGRRELWGFFWLSIANTAIITVAGVATWLVIH